jgi:5-hydroxyisourate hydrolase-like protein (transthyretin family)
MINSHFNSTLSHSLLRIFCFILVLFCPFLGIAQKVISGKVMNGTTGKPAAGQTVELMVLSQGMRSTAEAHTKADGTFRLDASSAEGAMQMLLRVIYQGVNYNRAVSPGSDASVEIEIFESTIDSRQVHISLPVILVQASGTALLVQEQYFVENNSQPPRTFEKPAGTFFFDIPAEQTVQELAVSVLGLSGIPLPQTLENRKEGGHFIAYPMKPGRNEVRISYRVNYSSNHRLFKHRIFYTMASTRVLVLPANLKVESEALSSAGSDLQTGASAYIASGLSPTQDLEFILSGQAPEVNEATGDPPSAAPSSTDDERVVRIPNRIYQKKGIILGSLGFFFILVILFAIRQSVSPLETISSKKK